MTNGEEQPESLLPLTPAVFHILLALSDRSRHGYGIMLEVARQTNGDVRLGPGTLYGSIKRMLASNLIVEADGDTEPEKQRRRYYRLTKTGVRVAKLEAKRLEQLVQEARLKQLLPEAVTKRILEGNAR